MRAAAVPVARMGRVRRWTRARHGPAPSVGMCLFAPTAVVLVLVGCSPTATVDPTGSPGRAGVSGSAAPTSPTVDPTKSSSSPDDAAPCTSEAIVAALPAGATISRFSCEGDYSGAVYKTAADEAAAVLRFDTGSGRWAEDKSACASGNLPDSMKQYCVS